MKSLAFAARNHKEIIRDPLNLAFGIGFPLVILLLLTAIQANVPTELFVIDKLIPGIAVFGLSFISLFSGMLIAKDRSTSFYEVYLANTGFELHVLLESPLGELTITAQDIEIEILDR